MTNLLVSVVSAAEARIALKAGADLIDVKDPQKGSLGAPTHDMVRSVVAQVAKRLPVSVALGELRDLENAGDLEGFPKVDYAKIGLAGLAGCHDWPRRWAAALRRLAPGVSPVAVVYADWRTIAAPAPAKVLIEAQRLGCAAVLVDTYDKCSGHLLDWWDQGSLGDFTASVQRLGMLAVLAGSLTIDTVQTIALLRPDFIAVRGAVCEGGRSGPLIESRVRGLAQLLADINSRQVAAMA